ncbi:MAG: hypothetical protein U0R44_02440 [Candidatus Micrarchaeia archaeon]
MSVNHNKQRFKSLVAVNLVAWCAGGVFLYKNCRPIEEPPRAGIIGVPQSDPAGTSSCSPGKCVFRLKDNPVPREVRMFWLAQLGTRFASARERLDMLERSGAPPLLTFNDPEMAGLMRAIARVDDDSVTRYGYEPIPLSGPDARERFRSLNIWLGREPDAPMNERALGGLDLKIVEAVMQ